MGINGTTRGGSGAGRGDNPHYPWHPSMGTPPPTQTGGAGGKKPPKNPGSVGGATDDGRDKKDNVYDFNEFVERKKKKGEPPYEFP